MRTRIGVALAALTLFLPAAASAAPDPAAQKLAQRYAPIAMLREQQDPPCETTAEQYQPTSVETVLGNPEVTLTHEVPGEGLEDVKKAPTAADVAGLRDGYYLDLEGEALGVVPNNVVHPGLLEGWGCRATQQQGEDPDEAPR